MTPFSSPAMSACLARKAEILLLLACIDKKPEYMHMLHGEPGGGEGAGVGVGVDVWSGRSGLNRINPVNLIVKYYGSQTTYLPDYALLSPHSVPFPVADTVFGLTRWSANASSFDFDLSQGRPVFELQIAESKILQCMNDWDVVVAASKIFVGQSDLSIL